ncbi:GerMN domain-containing protein [Plantactinospora sp. WMMC1484]|uniref:GerMN domain-containing protein n=1 Tax=Plantactinospora sp. WMMC1484 TaxID=3404122 RepID=UPI003BF5F952
MSDERWRGPAEPVPGDEELLRRILAAEADRIDPEPGALPAVQRRIAAGDRGAAGRRWWDITGRRWWGGGPGWSLPEMTRRRSGRWSPFAAGAVTVATLSLVAVAAGLVGTVVPTPSDRTEPPPGAAGTDGSATPTTPTGDVRPGPTPSGGALAPSPGTSAGTPAAAPGAPTDSLAVYYLGGDPDKPRLYREFHRLWLRDGSARDRITAAVRNLLDSPVGMDPDYRNAWPEGTDLRGVTVDGEIATVDLAGAARHDVGAATARLAVQQLVWTVTAVPGVSGLRLRLDGAPVDRLWDRVDTAGVLRRASAVEALAPVWLISPQHGDAVGRTFPVHVAGILPEATAQLRIRRDGRVVREQVVTLSIAGPAQGERTVTVTLPPGRYTVTAYAISLADGSEQHLDDHTITVR